MSSSTTGLDAATRPPGPGESGERHIVQFYEEDDFLIETVASFIGGALGAGEAAIVIATAPHRELLEKRLLSRGVDLLVAREQERYFALDAADTLSSIQRGEQVDAKLFDQVVGGAVVRATGGGRRAVRAFGEMVALLWADGKRDAVFRLEEMWTGLGGRQPLTTLCSYPISGFRREEDRRSFGRICGEHSLVVPGESYTSLPSRDERSRAVADLQQKARVLEAEIAHRKEAEETLRRSNQTLRALIGASPLPIVVVDPAATVQLWNSAAEEVFGWAEHEVIGRPCPIVPPDKIAECANIREIAMRGERLSRVETSRLRRDGTLVEVLISAAPLSQASGPAIVLLFEDVTERNRVEADRHRAQLELTTIYEVGQALSGELDIGKLLQALTDASTLLSGAKFGAFVYNTKDDPDGHHPLYTLSGVRREAFDAFGVHNTDLFAPTFAGEGVIRLDDVSKDPRHGLNAPKPGTPAEQLAVASYLAVPVVGRAGEVFGGLLLGHPEPAMFGEEAERAVVGLAAQAAVAIDNARLYDAERRARGEAEASDRAKDEFLAMLGHELRNPLSAVQNAVVTARLDPNRREQALEIASRGADKLRRLVDDLLDVARITQGRITLRRQRLPLAGVLERAVETTKPLIEERAHALTVALPASDVYVDADSTRLEQAVANLISNAAKYTDPGGRIVVSAEPEGSDVVLRVRDNGMGIAPAMLPRVFDLFAQADRALDRAQGGLGIGLTVVKRLVELHGGQITAHSEGEGRGAEFVVRLPAVRAPREEVVEVASSPPVRQGCARVLLVEDNADAAESMTLLLEMLGHRVHAVGDGPAALATVAADPPEVMLIDIGLPGMNGYEVARRIRQDPALRRVVLVALTGYGRDEDRELALAAGFDHHLVKPVDPRALHGLVVRVKSEEPRGDEPKTVH